MFSRFCAIALILVSGIHTLSVDASALASECDDSGISLGTQSDVSMQDAQSVLSSAEHFPGDGHEGGCEKQPAAHGCHMGHCNFLVGSFSRVLTPNLKVSSIFATNAFYTGVDLSSLKKPPRA